MSNQNKRTLEVGLEPTTGQKADGLTIRSLLPFGYSRIKLGERIELSWDFSAGLQNLCCRR